MALSNLTWFWIAAGGMTVIVVALLLLALRRGGTEGDGAAADLRVYRDQLREIDRDVARGVVAVADAERLRTEISRRILAADAAMAKGALRVTPLNARRVAGAAILAVVIAGSVLVYREVGAPGYPDLPLAARIAAADAVRAERPGQAAAETGVPALPPTPEAADPRYMALITQLRIAVAARPDDVRGQELLAYNEQVLGNYAAAHRAQAAVIALRGAEATAEDHAALGELMVAAAGGYVSPEAEAAFSEVLRRDPANGTALYYLGQMFAQTGRFDLAFRLWRPLLDRSGADDPWVAPIRGQIEEVAQRAGVRYTLPPVAGAPGPTQEQVTAAQDMTPEERTAMIRTMVAGLAERLADGGGTAEEWARLIRAYGVLGDKDAAAAAWAQAQAALAQTPDAVAQVRAAAVSAGVAE